MFKKEEKIKLRLQDKISKSIKNSKIILLSAVSVFFIISTTFLIMHPWTARAKFKSNLVDKFDDLTTNLTKLEKVKKDFDKDSRNYSTKIVDISYDINALFTEFDKGFLEQDTTGFDEWSISIINYYNNKIDDINIQIEGILKNFKLNYKDYVHPKFGSCITTTKDGQLGLLYIWGKYTSNNGNYLVLMSTLKFDCETYLIQAKQYIENLNKRSTVTDLDGNLYQTLAIGTQVWMIENLKVTRYRDGQRIPTEDYFDYNNDTNNVDIYGKLYSGRVLSKSYNISPDGWHVPSAYDWQKLFRYLGGTDIAGAKLKETGKGYWNSPNIGASNESGFTALPSGYRDSEGNFIEIGNLSRFWSTSEVTLGRFGRMPIDIKNDSKSVFAWGGLHSSFALSIRCVKD